MMIFSLNVYIVYINVFIPDKTCFIIEQDENHKILVSPVLFQYRFNALIESGILSRLIVFFAYFSESYSPASFLTLVSGMAVPASRILITTDNILNQQLPQLSLLLSSLS